MRHDDWYSDADVNRAQIFVPVIMGAGVLISVLTLVRDSLHERKWRGRARRIALEAHATAHHVLTGEPASAALRAGVRPRISYLLAALSSGGVGGYVGVGATLNYQRPGGYVVGIAWLLAVSLATTAVLGAVAVACLMAFLRWPRLARWQLPLLAQTPLGQRPEEPGAGRDGPPLLLGWAAAAVAAAAAIFTFLVAAAPHRVAGVDEWFARAAEGWGFVAVLGPLDPFGPLPVYLVAMAVIGLATLRCPVVAVAYLLAAVAGVLLDAGLRVVVPRNRPPTGEFAGADNSFPSGHEIQAVLLAGFVALAVLVLARRRRLAWVAAAVLGVPAIAASMSTLHDAQHWWSDVVAGLLWGGALMFTGWWALGHRRWHRHCNDCPLAGQHPSRAGAGLISLPSRVERAIRFGSRAWVPVAVAAFTLLSVVVGLPVNPEGDPLSSQVQGPAQVALLALAGLGWLVALRWEAPGAVLLALAGSTLGVLAALAFHPLVSLAVAAVFLAPAAGFWLVWQHRRTIRAVAVLAVTTAMVLSGTWLGASAVYDHYFGPAHPASPEQPLPVDQVVWTWAGGVTGTQATVVAEVVAGRSRARLQLQRMPGGPLAPTPPVEVGADHVARFTIDGLEPDTQYRYSIEVDGVADRSRGIGVLRTVPDTASSFTIAFGSCARTGSSGAVFDAIRAVDPMLFVETGDLHYGNPSRNDVALFARLYRQTISSPAQAALYRSVPVAYVWDDHDYGPNDADASAPTRAAARAAYDRYVPHYPLAAGQGGAIYQAFTVGRVRIVLTDTRSERTQNTMLGDRQLAWLERELVEASRTHAVVVWVNPDPWIAPADPTRDDWGAYPDERRRLADVIAAAGIRNLVMVSGDAHMVAIDSGANTGYSTAGYPGFPLLQAAALDRPGGIKGGPYSEGTFPGAGQFGTLAIADTGGRSVGVTLSGRNWRGEVIVSYQVELGVPGVD